MPKLPRIVLEPLGDRDQYQITVEAPGGDVRKATTGEIQSLVGDFIEFVPSDDEILELGLQLRVNRVAEDSIHWSDARLKTDVRPL